MKDKPNIKIVEKIITPLKEKKAIKVAKKENELAEDRRWVENCIFKDFSKEDITKSSKCYDFNGKIKNLTEFDIKLSILEENKFLYQDGEYIERYNYLLKFIGYQSSIVRTSIEDVFKLLNRNYKSRDLENPLVYELTKNIEEFALEEIVLIYKQYILDKNKDLLGDEYYQICTETINNWYNNARNENTAEKILER